MPLPWENIATKRKREISIPEDWMIDVNKDEINENSSISVINYPTKFLTPEELVVTNAATPALIKNLQLGLWTSTQVVLAFCKRAAIAHQLTNCLTDLLHEEALDQALKLDKLFKTSGHAIGPLHGVPVSLKDVFELRGYDCTWGLISNVGKKYSNDGDIVRVLKNMGAVVIAKTNVAQGLLLVESINNVFGKVLNPRNLSLTPGGSSGGEAALVAMRGSVLGIGTDGGGSIRIPAASTGVYGFYPTPERVTSKGISNSMGDRGLKWVQGGVGPLANDMEAIKLYAEVMMGHHRSWEYDPFCVPLPWGFSAVPENHQLKVGFMYEDGIIEFTPPMKRIMHEVHETVKKETDIITIKVDFADIHRRAVETVFAMYISSGCSSYKEALRSSGEPAVNRVCGSEYCPEMSLNEVHQLNTQARSICNEYFNRLKSYGLHALITPACANPPAPHGQYSSNCLSAVYNLLGYPVGVIPVGKIDCSLDKPSPNYTNARCYPPIDVPNYTYDKYDSYVKKELYTDIRKFYNAPLSIQVTSPKYFDENLVAIMSIIDQAIHK